MDENALVATVSALATAVAASRGLFRRTTAGENVGADLRAATSLTRRSPRRSAAPTLQPHFHKECAMVQLAKESSAVYVGPFKVGSTSEFRVAFLLTESLLLI